MPLAIAAVVILAVILLYYFGHIGGGLSLWLSFNPVPPMYTQPPQPVVRIQTVAPVQAPALPAAGTVVATSANPTGSVTTLRIEVVSTERVASTPVTPTCPQGQATVNPETSLTIPAPGEAKNPEVVIRLPQNQ